MVIRNPSDMSREVCQFAHLLDALACGAALLDRTGRVVHLNPRAAQMIGFDARDVVGRNLAEFYTDPAALEFIRAALEDIGRPREGEFYLPATDGRQVPVVISGRAWRGDAPGTGGACADLYAVTLTDISPLKAAEDDLRTQYRIIAELSNNILAQAEDLRGYSEQLENRVRERTLELHDANMDAIYMLAIASESKDEDTGRHVRRIQRYSSELARELGFPKSEAERIGYSAILHDVGKIHVPDHVLKKPGPLTPDERALIQEHTLAGEHILSAKPFFATARTIARSHHENWDGSGYPDRVGADEIAVEARIVHLADVYDALTTPRVYKVAWDAYDASKVIEESVGKMFDPEVVRAFRSLRGRNELAPEVDG